MLSLASALRRGSRWLLAGALVVPGAAEAQSFTLPQECAQYGATGSEGDDPVVIVVDNYVNQWITTFTLQLISQQPVIQWGITISPFRGGLSGYNIFTTYTPFLTSDALVQSPSSWSAFNVYLPQPGVSAGRRTAIYGTFNLQIRNQAQTTPVPYAFVDFIPDFVGSSPLTIQADGNGMIALRCVQQNFQGYNITVYDANHQYLYDGSFAAHSNNATGAQAPAPGKSAVGSGFTRPHADKPQ